MCESLRSGTVISIRNARKESRRDRHLLEFIAGKRSVKFRFLEAAANQRAAVKLRFAGPSKPLPCQPGEQRHKVVRLRAFDAAE